MPSQRPLLSVVISAYDERDTIAELTHRLAAALDALPGWRWELIYVVEGDDGTREIVAGLAAERPEIRWLHQPGRSGLGASFRRGFAAVSTEAEYVVTMDADLNHQPEEISRLLETARRLDSDVLVGSRFVRGGRIDGTPLWKLGLSRTLGAVMRCRFGVPVRDKSSGFRVYRASALARLSFSGDNFAFLPEMLILAWRSGMRIAEEPIHFVHRRLGKSKMGLWSTSLSYVSLLLRPLGGAAGPRFGSLTARRTLLCAGALLAGLYFALIASPVPAASRARVSADTMAFVGQAWLWQQGELAYRDISTAWGPLAQLLTRVGAAIFPGEFVDAGPMIGFVFRATGAIALATWVCWLPLRRMAWTALPFLAFVWTLRASEDNVFRVALALVALRAAAAALASAERVSWPKTGLAAATLLALALSSFDVFVYALVALLGGTLILASAGPSAAREELFRKVGALAAVSIGVALVALGAAAWTAVDRAQGFFAPLQRMVERAASYAQVFGLPIQMGPLGLVAWTAIAALAIWAGASAARRTLDPIRFDLALLAPFALVSLKSAITRGDSGHVAFGLTGLLALVSILPGVEVERRGARALSLSLLGGALLLWPSATLATKSPASETAHPGLAWKAMRERAAAPGLLPREMLSIASERAAPLFVFPLQIGFAAAANRPLVAPVDQAYGAHTPAMQEHVVRALDGAGSDLEVIYGLDGLPTWKVDQVQSIARSPVIAEYLLSEFEPQPRRVLDGGFLLLRRRPFPRSLAWRPMPFRPQESQLATEAELSVPDRCPLFRVELELDYPKAASLTWFGGVRLRLEGEGDGQIVARTRLVPLRLDRTFATLVSPLEGEAFAALFDEGALPVAPETNRLVFEPEDTGPFGVAPARIRISALSCLDVR